MNSPLHLSLPHAMISFGSQGRTGLFPHSLRLHIHREMCRDLPPGAWRVHTSAFQLWAEKQMADTRLEQGTHSRRMDLGNRTSSFPNPESFKADPGAGEVVEVRKGDWAVY